MSYATPKRPSSTEPEASGSDISFPHSRASVWRNFSARFAIATACLFITTGIVYFGRNGYYDNQGGEITLLDALYFSTVSLSTTGYGDIVPADSLQRFLAAVIITPLRILFLIVLVGSTLEVLTRRTAVEFREQRWRKTLHDHTVIIGFGVKGRAACKAILDNGGDPAKIVVVGADEKSAEEAANLGCVGIVGNARRDEVLLRAGMDRCKRVIIATESDETTVLITLNARRLNPTAIIVAGSREAQNVPTLRQSGADSVITTSEAAGRLMGVSLVSPLAGSVIEDVLDPSGGLEVLERNIEPDEVGQLIGFLASRGETVLALVREGVVYRFDSDGPKSLAAGDSVVVIRRVLDEE